MFVWLGYLENFEMRWFRLEQCLFEYEYSVEDVSHGRS